MKMKGDSENHIYMNSKKVILHSGGLRLFVVSWQYEWR